MWYAEPVHLTDVHSPFKNRCVSLVVKCFNVLTSYSLTVSVCRLREKVDDNEETEPYS